MGVCDTPKWVRRADKLNDYANTPWLCVEQNLFAQRRWNNWHCPTFFKKSVYTPSCSWWNICLSQGVLNQMHKCPTLWSEQTTQVSKRCQQPIKWYHHLECDAILLLCGPVNGSGNTTFRRNFSFWIQAHNVGNSHLSPTEYSWSLIGHKFWLRLDWTQNCRINLQLDKDGQSTVTVTRAVVNYSE